MNFKSINLLHLKACFFWGAKSRRVILHLNKKHHPLGCVKRQAAQWSHPLLGPTPFEVTTMSRSEA